MTDWRPGYRHFVRGVDDSAGAQIGWRCDWCGQQFEAWPSDEVACPGPDA